MTTTQKTTDVTARRRSHWWWAVPGCLAMVLLNAAISYGIVRLNAPVTAAFNMKQTVDAFFDSASQKQLSEAQSKALSARFNTALEASLQVSAGAVFSRSRWAVSKSVRVRSPTRRTRRCPFRFVRHRRRCSGVSGWPLVTGSRWR